MIKSDLGAVTAYADAVKHGYTGTREDFGKLLANAGLNLEAAAAAKVAAEAAAGNASTAAQTASDAAGTAGQAAGAATNAAEAANASAGKAAQSAEAAETAQQGAENAAKKAVEAKTGAENALKDADTAKDAASGYADAATESATAAEASATNAADSAKSASDAAQKIEDSAEKIEQNADAVSQLKEDTAALQKRQNVLVGSETGNPVSCDDAFAAPLCGLTIYGKSTQDGTPSQDNPVPIVSAGDSGSVAVKVTGKNLLNPALFQNNKYQGFNAETGYYGIDSVNGYWITGIQPCLPNTTYHFNKAMEGGCFYDNEKKAISIAGFDFSLKTPARCAYYCVNFSEHNVPYGSQVVATVNKPATVSPYYEQILTLPTPTGLPGIPVTSGGNYTDPHGQQWVCDEVDLERGVKVQRVDTAAFDSTKTLAEQNAILAAPIETPLTPAEIAAYKALTTYAPDTVVQASDDAGVKLDYQRDVNLVVKNLEDAIASMTTT